MNLKLHVSHNPPLQPAAFFRRLTPADATRPAATRRGRKLEKELLHKVGQAIGDHSLISEGDRIMVGMSGGKDSYALLRILSLLRKRAPISFELVAVNIDQGYRGFRADVIEDYCLALGYETHIEPTDVADIVDQKLSPGATPCSLCARLRRGVMYGLAQRLECNKIALGHHLDDVIETLLLNLFFNGELKAMPAFLNSDSGDNVVIRPLVYCREDTIEQYARCMEFPLIGCMCSACGDQALQRARVKKLLAQLEGDHPGLKSSMIRAVGNVKPTHLLDRRLCPS